MTIGGREDDWPRKPWSFLGDPSFRPSIVVSGEGQGDGADSVSMLSTVVRMPSDSYCTGIPG